MRFINKQPNKTACGPVAIANSLKVVGYRGTTKRTMALLSCVGSYVPRWGMSVPGIKQALELYNIKYTRLNKINIKHIEKAIDNGLGILAGIANDVRRHAFFINGQTPHFFRVNNLNNKQKRVSKKRLSKLLRQSSGLHFLFKIQGLKSK